METASARARGPGATLADHQPQDDVRVHLDRLATPSALSGSPPEPRPLARRSAGRRQDLRGHPPGPAPRPAPPPHRHPGRGRTATRGWAAGNDAAVRWGGARAGGPVGAARRRAGRCRCTTSVDRWSLMMRAPLPLAPIVLVEGSSVPLPPPDDLGRALWLLPTASFQDAERAATDPRRPPPPLPAAPRARRGRRARQRRGRDRRRRVHGHRRPDRRRRGALRGDPRHRTGALHHQARRALLREANLAVVEHYSLAARGATDAPSMRCRWSACATKPEAFISSMNSRRYFAPASPRLFGVPIA